MSGVNRTTKPLLKLKTDKGRSPYTWSNLWGGGPRVNQIGGFVLTCDSCSYAQVPLGCTHKHHRVLPIAARLSTSHGHDCLGHEVGSSGVPLHLPIQLRGCVLVLFISVFIKIRCTPICFRGSDHFKVLTCLGGGPASLYVAVKHI
jgi:hypothetical protein